ncbi:MAG: hypothetical protein EA422_09330 [Gemmatimonadales bacterium]|nr:MAG: hypothetical protein EA422_09330 [Gemmatimonadales bacterium]
MDVPPEIAFRGLEPTDALKSRILEGIDDLEEVHSRMVSCRVVVEDTTPGRTSGKVFRVRVDVGIPGNSLVVDWKPETDDDVVDADQAIRNAFSVARRRLRKAGEKTRAGL